MRPTAMALSPKQRVNNRLLVLCTSINDVTAWPFWKFLQMKKIKGVTDMALLAFNSEGGSFEARIDGEKYTMKNYSKVKGYREEMFQDFLSRWHDPGRSYFVYGGHGMGDYLELEQHKFSLQAHELAALLGPRRFEAILFDACFMSNIDCAYHLRDNTRYIGACEGYMWEPDTALDYHIFNTFTASAMSRFRDPRLILETIQKEYTAKAPRGDFAVLDTTHVAELRRFVHEHVMQRVYNHATLYSPAQQERLSLLTEAALAESIAQHGQPGGDSYLDALLTHRNPASSAPVTPDGFALANSGRLTRKQRVAAAIQFEHSLYPSEALDKHLVDLRSYLVDMLQEEEAEAAARTASAAAAATAPTGDAPQRPRRRPQRKAAAGATTPSRAYKVDAHGTVPPPLVVPSPPSSSTESVPSAKDSARYGLELLDKVVVSHVAPRSAGIYGARLGGLSVAVHEYSAMSRPVEPWQVSKTVLNRKVKAFLAKGALEEVTMGGDGAEERRRGWSAASRIIQNLDAAAAAAASAATTSATAAKSCPKDGDIATTTVNENSSSSSSGINTGSPSRPVVISCHQQQQNAPQQQQRAVHTVTTSLPLTAAAAAAGGGGGGGGVPAGVSTGSSGPSGRAPSSSLPFVASSSAYSSLSSRSRSYASLSRRPSGSTSASSSSSSSLELLSLEERQNCGDVDGEAVGTLRRPHSADEIRDIQRMAMEAAQLLDRVPPYF